MSDEAYGITGGCGYVGYRLALALLRQQPNCTVRLLDIKPPPTVLYHDTSSSSDRPSSPFPLHPSHLSQSELSRLSFTPCDLTSLPTVTSALADLTFLYHLASYGMSGAEMMNERMTSAVNVAGTAHLLSACRQHGVRSLVYVSTYNVIYNGRPIVAGDESLPYPPLFSHTDTYSRTKTIAEQMVRNAATSSLRVAVIRPAAIYGDGEERHLPRILRLVQRGMAVFAIGHSGVMCDWVYVDNLVHVLILTSHRLQLDHDSHLLPPPDRVYFISDDQPVNNFTFLSLIIQPLHLPPTFLFYIPTSVMLLVAQCIEVVHGWMGRVGVRFSPFLTRAEVSKVGVEHWMVMDKAKKELGWEVVVGRDEAVRRCVDWYGKEGYGSGGQWTSNKVNGGSAGWWGRAMIMILAVIVLLYLLLIHER